MRLREGPASQREWNDMHEHSLQDPQGRQLRVRSGDERKKDRQACLRYGSRRGSAPTRSGGAAWSASERWALAQDLFIGDVLDDHGAHLSEPPHSRPGLVRLAALTRAGLPLPGPVLVERGGELIDPLTKAV